MKKLRDILVNDNKEEMGLADRENKRALLKEEFQRKVKEEEIKWRHRSRCRWLKEGDKNTRFFHGLTSTRRRGNRISSLLDKEKWLDTQEESIDHIKDYFNSLYAKEEWTRPKLDILNFDKIDEKARWFEREFEHEEV